MNGMIQLSVRKTICPNCGKIVPDTFKHDCPIKRQAYNKSKREYYQKNKETQKPLRTKRWKTLRSLIIALDGGYCQRCYRKYGIINSHQLEVHHIKARIFHPELTFDQDNCVTLCKTCNIQLGTTGIDFEWTPDERKNTEFNL